MMSSPPKKNDRSPETGSPQVRSLEIFNFQGSFSPPMFSPSSELVKIIGSGCCELTDRDIRIQGFQDIRFTIVDWCVQLFYLLIITLIAIALGGLIGPISIGLIIHIYIRNRRSKESGGLGKSIDLIIPWEKVSYVRQDKKTNAIVFCIKKIKSRYGRYQGEFFFVTEDAQDLLSRCVSYGIKRKS